MAIFSRRTLQRLSNENASFLTTKQLRKHVDSMNNADEHSLGAEWEVVLLNCFSKAGTVTHEPKLGKRPDLHFVSNAHKSVEFIADIATVSDRGFDERYPFEVLFGRLGEFVYKAGLKNRTFSVKVGTEAEKKVWPPSNPRLKIPHRSRLDQDVFNANFFRFLDAVVTAPEEPREYHVVGTTPSVDAQIAYDPSGHRRTSWPFPDELTSLVRNTVYSRLDDKAQQLSDANYDGPRAIIICDGGCNHLNTKQYFHEPDIDDVVRYFLQEHPRISFVLTFVVEETLDRSERKLVTTLYRGRSFAPLGCELTAAIEQMGQFLPEPERSPVSAKDLLEGPKTNEGESFGGGYGMSEDEIKISARGLLELLSGRITQERFFQSHAFVQVPTETKRAWNPFESQLSQGSLITEVRVESGEEEKDDDWLTIKFGAPDPAVSPFEVPPQ
jgi:hypothetical protein